MTPEERIDLNERRLNDHATRTARLEERNSNLEDDIKCLRSECMTGFKEIKSEMRTYFGPIQKLTAAHDRSITTLQNDVGWMKPWFKRVTVGALSLAAIGAAIKVFAEYGPF